MKKTIEEALRDDPAQMIEDAQTLVEATADVASEKVAEARKRLKDVMERVAEYSKDTWNTVSEKTMAGARMTDETIRENPYSSIGIALGVGALLGFLLSRPRD